MKKAYSMIYRTKEKDFFKKLIKGETLINPLNNLNNIINWDLLLIHSKADKSLNYENTIHFYNKIKNKNKVKIKLIEKANHGLESRKKSINLIINWAKNN